MPSLTCGSTDLSSLPKILYRPRRLTFVVLCHILTPHISFLVRSMRESAAFEVRSNMTASRYDTDPGHQPDAELQIANAAQRREPRDLAP